jgi:hypothetical protein
LATPEEIFEKMEKAIEKEKPKEKEKDPSGHIKSIS